jgi:hypothetical protein
MWRAEVQTTRHIGKSPRTPVGLGVQRLTQTNERENRDHDDNHADDVEDVPPHFILQRWFVDAGQNVHGSMKVPTRSPARERGFIGREQDASAEKEHRQNILLDVPRLFFQYPDIAKPVIAGSPEKGGYDVGSQVSHRVHGLRWSCHHIVWLDRAWARAGFALSWISQAIAVVDTKKADDKVSTLSSG